MVEARRATSAAIRLWRSSTSCVVRGLLLWPARASAAVRSDATVVHVATTSHPHPRRHASSLYRASLIAQSRLVAADSQPALRLSSTARQRRHTASAHGGMKG